MKKNKKARITLEFAIGIVLSILILIAVLNIVGGLFRLSDDSRQSFYKLVSLIKDVNRNSPAGTLKTTALRMDKETFIVGFAKEEESFLRTILVPGREMPLKEDKKLIKLDFEGCEKDKSCICLCRDLEDKDLDDGIITCKEDSVFCESFDDVSFTESFVISRHLKVLQITDPLSPSQFREVCVEKYKNADEEFVAVCENTVDGSCVSEEYKEQSEAIEGLNELAKFIESCKNKEFSGEPCSCGAFDFKSDFPERYIVEFTESDEKNLKLILKHEDKKDEIISSIEVDMPICIFYPILKGLDYPKDESIIEYLPLLYNYYLDKDESIILKYNLPTFYTFYYKGNIEDERIIFIKESNENICILEYSERGYIGLDAESLDTITFKPVSNIQRGEELGHSEINITGCKYLEEAE
ncbi:MAG: hypothetical protein KKA61_00935 [Nanoarchaeota archaeon]|nr:hypothetical protein [Nanoarchaeota archaeon]MBU4492914.1 hypothetical protein [Nanoarchaeota archaeon]